MGRVAEERSLEWKAGVRHLLVFLPGGAREDLLIESGMEMKESCRLVVCASFLPYYEPPDAICSSAH